MSLETFRSRSSRKCEASVRERAFFPSFRRLISRDKLANFKLHSSEVESTIFEALLHEIMYESITCRVVT